MIKFLVTILTGFLVTILVGASAAADSLTIQPSIIKDIVIAKGQNAKSFVEINNPTGAKQEIKISVQGFEQIDNNGNLRFFDDPKLKNSIKLDLDNFELAPRDTIKLYFLIDGSTLPQGNVFAAIFARTVPVDGAVSNSVQVGSLLAIKNGNAGAQAAKITNLKVDYFQLGESIDFAMSIKNYTSEQQSVGFFPSISVDAKPYSSRQVEGPLLFAGRERDVSYTQKGNYFGLVNLQVSAGDNTISRWVFAVTGFWIWLAPLILLLLAGLALYLVKFKSTSGLTQERHND